MEKDTKELEKEADIFSKKVDETLKWMQASPRKSALAMAFSSCILDACLTTGDMLFYLKFKNIEVENAVSHMVGNLDAKKLDKMLSMLPANDIKDGMVR